MTFNCQCIKPENDMTGKCRKCGLYKYTYECLHLRIGFKHEYKDAALTYLSNPEKVYQGTTAYCLDCGETNLPSNYSIYPSPVVTNKMPTIPNPSIRLDCCPLCSYPNPGQHFQGCPLAPSINMNNTDKPKSEQLAPGVEQVPFEGIEAIGAIFEEGRTKYGLDNWKKDPGNEEYNRERTRHAIRHLTLWANGDRSEPHLAKVAWFCVTTIWREKNASK